MSTLDRLTHRLDMIEGFMTWREEQDREYSSKERVAYASEVKDLEAMIAVLRECEDIIREGRMMSPGPALALLERIAEALKTVPEMVLKQGVDSAMNWAGEVAAF